MNAISYVVAALPEPTLCLLAANALRDLCDANRAALAPHIGAFAELHAGLNGIPVRRMRCIVCTVTDVLTRSGYGKEQSSSVNRKCDTSLAT
jgi:hypothetical protein